MIENILDESRFSEAVTFALNLEVKDMYHERYFCLVVNVSNKLGKGIETISKGSWFHL